MPGGHQTVCVVTHQSDSRVVFRQQFFSLLSGHGSPRRHGSHGPMGQDPSCPCAALPGGAPSVLRVGGGPEVPAWSVSSTCSRPSGSRGYRGPRHPSGQHPQLQLPIWPPHNAVCWATVCHTSLHTGSRPAPFSPPLPGVRPQCVTGMSPPHPQHSDTKSPLLGHGTCRWPCGGVQ